MFRSIRPWIKSGSKILEKKKVEIFEVDFCNAAGTRNTPLIILRLIFWWNVPYPTFFFQPCWSDYKGRDQAKKSGRLGVLEEVGGPTCWLSWRGKIVTIPKGPTAHQRLSNRPLPKGWIETPEMMPSCFCNISVCPTCSVIIKISTLVLVHFIQQYPVPGVPSLPVL